MKLTARDIDAFLKAPLLRSQAALLYGPDSGLAHERARVLCQAILGKDADPLQRVELSADQVKSDPVRLRDEMSALSLMGGQRLIMLSGAGDKIASIIAEAFEGLTPTAYLVVMAEELGPSSPLRALFEKEPRFGALACYRDDARALSETIRTVLRGHGLTVSHDAMQYLADELGNDRGVTLSELEKIALYMGHSTEVTLEIATALTGGNAADTTEDLCHAVAAGNAAAAEDLLAQLLREGEQPVPIIRAALRHFQRIDIALAHVAAGNSPTEAAGMLRPPVFFKYMPAVINALSRWRARSLAAAQNLLLRAEKDMKSGNAPASLLAAHALRDVAKLAG